MTLAADPNFPLILLGAALCLFGWTLYWGGIHALGAAAGGALLAGLAWAAMERAEYLENRPLILGVAAAMGILVGVFLIRRLHYGALALAGAALGLLAGMAVNSLCREAGIAWARDDIAVAVFAAAGTLIGALVFLFLHRYVIIVITSVAGAGILGVGLPLKDSPLLVPFSALALALIFQLGVTRKLGLDRVEAARRKMRKD